jgi:hypothetical protein
LQEKGIGHLEFRQNEVSKFSLTCLKNKRFPNFSRPTPWADPYDRIAQPAWLTSKVNIHPAFNWREAVEITRGLYEDARLARLGAAAGCR